MWQVPTPAEQELWNAVVAGVRAANQKDHAQFRTCVDRLLRLPHAWVHQVLRDTAGLLADELGPDGWDQGPRLAAQIDHSEDCSHRLLLIAQLADAAQVGVGAFVDAALAHTRRPRRNLAGSVPHGRTGS
ncbi:hypothetical protein [Micromonospora sp. NPDC047527]|uniref:hypothetical protein n=1 Tax=unclassified Micromonospora TaxID=2617518 RepID=UPI0033DA3B41